MMMHQLLRFPIRAFSSAPSAVNKELLSKLRKQTGIPFISCKKALAKFDNDFDQAKQWLVAEAQREGWTRATKLQSRPMSQGLVALRADRTQATMIEINCETDFVGKNEKFLAMATQLVEECSKHFKASPEGEVILSKSDLEQVPTPNHGSLADIVALTIGELGENMALRRGVVMQAAPGNVLSCYVHPSGGGSEARPVLLGKYGAVVELIAPHSSQSTHDAGETSLAELGKELCQHVVGMNPRTVGELPSTSKKEEVVKADDGYGSESSSGLEDADDKASTELLSQEFLLDSSVSVGEVLQARGGVGVARFVRFACGEEIEGENQ